MQLACTGKPESTVTHQSNLLSPCVCITENYVSNGVRGVGLLTGTNDLWMASTSALFSINKGSMRHTHTRPRKHDIRAKKDTEK